MLSIPDWKLESPSYPLAGVFGELCVRGVRGDSGTFCILGIVPVLVPLSKVAFEGTGGGRRLSRLKENLSSKEPPPGGVLVYMASVPSSGVSASLVSVSASPVSFMFLNAKILLILDFIVGLIMDMKIILRLYREEWTTAWLLSGAPLSLDWTGAAGSASVGFTE